MVTVYELWDRFANYVIDYVIRRDLDNLRNQPKNQAFVYHCKSGVEKENVVSSSGLECKILKFPDIKKDDDGPSVA